MKISKQGVCLALVGAGLAAVPAVQASATAPGASAPGKSLVQQMRDEAQGAIALSEQKATGQVGFVRAAGQGDLLPSVAGDSRAAAAEKAAAYLDKYAPAFGARTGELRGAGVMASPYGWTVSFLQVHRGVPVFGSQLKVTIDRAGDLTAVSGYAAPALDVDVAPDVSSATAGARAVSIVKSDPPGGVDTDTSGLRAASSELVIYRLGITKGAPGKAVLAHQVEVSNQRNIREVVLVDATTGKSVNRYSLVHNAAGTDRELYDQTRAPENLIWDEGDPLPGTLTEKQANLVQTAGEAYWLFANTFDYESYDGANATMVTVSDYLDPDPNYCPNANWNGSEISICTDTGPDDVTAHEWGHAYTEYTSGLIYQWQSGALNESYSDVWGETVDLINNREDAGETTQERPVGQCSSHSPPQPRLTVNAPYQEVCLTGGYLGPQPMPTVTADVFAPTDADEDGTGTTATNLDGCSTYDNAAAAAGKIVLVNRGNCTFVAKSQMAKSAGAAGLIIGNRDEAPVGFSDGDQTLVPTVSVGLSDREQMRTALAQGSTVNVTIEDASGTRADSYRWLMGEKSESFGGAIRDMWNPNCHGDPAKVSDAQYTCSTDDAGGVHSNSGVPNHAYALLVDGGTYNGVTVSGIGLDKAAQLWWKAQHDHLTPVSDFADLADALDASCTSLTGAPIRELSLTPNSPGAAAAPITAADCESVSAVIQATELRLDPTEQCKFTPMFEQGEGPICGTGTVSSTLFSEDFEDGLAGWGTSQDVVYRGATGAPWAASATPPGAWESAAAYGPAPDRGSCNGTAQDFSSRDSIVSPVIVVPRGKSVALRLSFNHYVATELGYDGGNVKYTTGGKWLPVPASAYTFNPPGQLETKANGNTNPMAGEPGFTGTDGGQVTGSWGQSQVDLQGLVKGGSKLRLRFDIGRDGCGGIDGWYVDDVTVVRCTTAAARTGATSGRR